MNEAALRDSDIIVHKKQITRLEPGTISLLLYMPRSSLRLPTPVCIGPHSRYHTAQHLGATEELSTLPVVR
jgi:hypothetical protein